MTKKEQILLESRILLLEATLTKLIFDMRDGSNMAFMCTRLGKIGNDFLNKKTRLIGEPKDE